MFFCPFLAQILDYARKSTFIQSALHEILDNIVEKRRIREKKSRREKAIKKGENVKRRREETEKNIMEKGVL